MRIAHLPRHARACLAGVLLAAALAAGAATAQGPAAAFEQRLQALRLQGRAQPEVAVGPLAALADGTAADSAERVAALELLGWLQAGMNEADGTERAATQLEVIAQGRSPQRQAAQAAAAVVRARLAYQRGPVNRAERLIATALALLPDGAPADTRLRYLTLAGDIQGSAGHLDEAVRLQLQAMSLADAGAPLWRRSEVRSALAYTLYAAGQKDRAHAMNRDAIAMAREAGDDVSMTAALVTESILIVDRHDDAAELDVLRGVIEHAGRAGARRDEVLGLANLADFYLVRGRYQTALELSERALPLAREVRSLNAESLALTNKGLALLGLRRKAEGMESVRAALAIEERAGAVTDMASGYEELGRYLEKTGELGDALDAYRQHRRLADEVFRREQQQAILELQESYDNERRNRELELLNRQSRLQEEQLLRRELQQRLWMAAVALAVMTLAVVVMLVQRGRRANRLLASTNELLRVQSERDPLTGLANRRHFQQAMRHLAADGRLAGSFFLIDIDHFKRINDGCGHAAGDAVLVEVAQRLRATLRDDDLVVRWGGEEFLVVVRARSPEQVEALAHRLLAVVTEVRLPPGGEGTHAATASIGFATFPLEPAGLAVSWERAIELVDAAMYLAKAHGRNRAYGVRLVHADDDAQVEALARSLEQSWREGRLALTALQGPAGAAAPAGSMPCSGGSVE